MMLHRTRAAAACSSSRAVAPVRRPHRHLHHTVRASGPAERSAHPEDEANSAGGFNSRKGPVSLDRRQLLNIGCTCACSSCLASSAQATAQDPSAPGWYKKAFAWVMQHGMDTYTAAIDPLKTQLFADLFASLQADSGGIAAAVNGEGASTSLAAQGKALRVLEVGCGTLPNLTYYARFGPEALELVGLEPNRAMFPYARGNALAADFAILPNDGTCSVDLGPGPTRSLRMVQGTAEALPFPDASFDAVVLTLVLCSVADQRKALDEAARCLKPEGRLLLVEHVVAHQPGLTRVAQQVLDPVQQVLADGCHLARDTLASLQASRFRVDEVQRGFDFDAAAAAEGVVGRPGAVGQVLALQVPGLGILSPHLAGVLGLQPATLVSKL